MSPDVADRGQLLASRLLDHFPDCADRGHAYLSSSMNLHCWRRRGRGSSWLVIGLVVLFLRWRRPCDALPPGRTESGRGDVARLEAGETVLIHSAAGGVGYVAVQIAQQIGARVIATVGTEEKRDFLRQRGVTLISDSRSQAFVDDVEAWSQPSCRWHSSTRSGMSCTN